MTQVSRNLRETLTHWSSTGSDGYAGFTWATPVTMNGRWEDTQVMFRTPDNEEVVSQGVVYTESDVAVGDYIAQTDLTATVDPTTLTAPKRIRQTSKNTNLSNLETIRKAFL